MLVARNREAMARLADELGEKYGTRSRIIQKDLSVPSGPEEIFAELGGESITIDALVNSAGFNIYGPFSESDTESQLRMMQVNMVSLTHLTRLFLDGMLKKGEGKILNLASTAAFVPGPLMAVYYASKAYVLSFSEALANELRGSGISVTVLCPGPTDTAFTKRAGVEQTRLYSGRVMDPRTVARIGYRGLMAGKRLVVPGFWNRLLVSIVRILPRGWVLRTVRRLNENRKG